MSVSGKSHGVCDHGVCEFDSQVVTSGEARVNITVKALGRMGHKHKIDKTGGWDVGERVADLKKHRC